MPSRQSDYVELIEACYGEADGDEAWCANITRALRKVFGTPDVGLCIMRQKSGHPHEVVTCVNHARVAAALDETLAGMPDLPLDAFNAIWRPQSPVSALSQGRLAHIRDRERDFILAGVERLKVSDVLAMQGEPRPGLLFSLVSFRDCRINLRGQGLELLHRMRLHIDAGLRLRYGRGSVVARIKPSGHVEHAETLAQGLATRAALRDGVAAIERCRAHDAPDSLALWGALIAGDLSLIPRTDSSGTTYYEAIENAPHARAFCTLNAMEARVLELTLSRLSGKQVAYALGVSDSYVSQCLMVAARKTGSRSLAELLALATHLVPQEPPEGELDNLSKSERSVLELARSGKSNREIAELRGTSLRTVCNQMAAVLRKTGIASRRGLATLPDSRRR